MDSLFLIGLVFIVVIVLLAIKSLSKQQAPGSSVLPYRKVDVLFTPAERSFLGVLTQAVGQDAQIFGKVRVADVILPVKGLANADRLRAMNKITSKHFDFVLCDSNDLSILCAIELNDSSHNSKKRKERDAFLEAVCESAGFPLVQVPARATYKIDEVRDAVAMYLKHEEQAIPNNENTIAPDIIQPAVEEVVCPKCSSKMVKRVAKKGKNIGSEFWACSSYPKCRYVKAIKAP